MPKTGTSVLQGRLAGARDDLRRQGVLYPAAGRRGIAHHGVAKALQSKDHAATAAFRAGLFAEITAEQATDPALRLVFVSSESFLGLCGRGRCAVLSDFIDSFAPDHPSCGVIYLREVTSFLESMYCQTMRFRSIDQTFASYLAPRTQWLRAFTAGLTRLKASLGDRFQIVIAGPGYDVLREFESLLAVRPGTLMRDDAEGWRSTARPSLKTQIVLSHLDQISHKLGFAIDRQLLLRRLGHAPIFEDDVETYTIYEPGQRAGLAQVFIKILDEDGFGDFARLTEQSLLSEAAYHPIDPERLSQRDISALTAARSQIEARPDPST